VKRESEIAGRPVEPDVFSEMAAIDDARAAVTAYIAALQETHALVPRLPNADMAAAGQWAIQNPVGFPPDNRRIITSQQVWIAMIDAAPPAAQEPRP
jgi:hypothetical protein